MIGRIVVNCGKSMLVGVLVLGSLLAARPAPAGAELYTVEEIVDYMVPFLDQYWAETMAWMGYPYASPAAVYYYNTPAAPGPVASGCGELGVNNAFYCWTDRSIYLDYTWLSNALATYGDFAVAAIVAHEWGHHIEQEFGMESGAFYSIQLELYADCATGAASATLDAMGVLDADDLEEAYELALTIGDPIGTDATAPGAHGISEQRIAAFMGGYLYGDPSGCGAIVDVLWAA